MTRRLPAPLLIALLFVASAGFAQDGTRLEGELKVPDAAQFVGQPAGSPRSGDDLLNATQRVGALLRCPVCQGMSVADSPAEMAVNMKGQVRELLARGYTEKQILDYFELSYGQFVLLKPKFEGVTSIVWMLPVAALLIGMAVLFVKLRRLEAAPSASIAAAAPVADLAVEQDPYLARVRDLVSGGKK